MFCPKCAAQNIDGASFCRACGANISLVPQALTGQLPTAEQRQWSDYSSRRRRNREPSIEEAIRSIIMGVAFTIVSILVSRYAPGGSVWWFWLLIPAFGSLGSGIAQYIHLKKMEKSQHLQYGGTMPQNSMPPPA